MLKELVGKTFGQPQLLRALWPAMQARYVDRRCMLDPSDFDMLKCAKHAIQLYALPDIAGPASCPAACR